MIRVISFGYKYGEPSPYNRVVDCRAMRNPHNEVGLKPLTGLDVSVQEFVSKDQRYGQLIRLATENVRSTDIIAIGCFGGRHRSVAVAEAVALELSKSFEVEVFHRELDIRKQL